MSSASSETNDVSSDTRATLAPAATGGLARLVDGLLLTVVLAACGLAVSHHNTDPDLWGHVRYGADVLSDGLPVETTYSYNADGYRWINHENLAELAFCLGLARWGQPTMLLLKCLLGVGVFYLMYLRASRQGALQLPTFTLLFLVAAALMHSWVMRPQLFSYLFFALLIAGLEWCFAESDEQPAGSVWQPKRVQWLWLAPLLFVVWANTHGGFAAGLAIFTAYLGCRSLEAIWRGGRPHWRRGVEWAALVLCCILCTWLNPYGWDLHRWMLASIGAPRPEITEWRPPALNYVMAPFWVLAGVAVASWLGSRRRRDLTHAVLLALVLWQAVSHRRHIAFFALLVGFWTPLHLQSLWDRFSAARRQTSFGSGLTPATAAFMATVLLVCGGLIGSVLSQQLKYITVKRSQYPVAAFQFIEDQNLRGKLVSRFMWAQYAISAFGSETPGTRLSSDRRTLAAAGRSNTAGIQIAFDGRFRTCYPQEVVDMYFDFAVGENQGEPRWRGPDSPPCEPGRILEFNRPDLVLIDRNQPHPVRVLQQNRGRWTLLYQDGLAQLWGRASIYDNRSDPRYLPPAARRISDVPQTGVVPWPAHPVRRHRPQQLAAQVGSFGWQRAIAGRSAN